MKRNEEKNAVKIIIKEHKQKIRFEPRSRHSRMQTSKRWSRDAAWRP